MAHRWVTFLIEVITRRKKRKRSGHKTGLPFLLTFFDETNNTRRRGEKAENT